MMKKLISFLGAITIAMSACVSSAFAIASHDPYEPTILTPGTAYESNVYYSNPGDYYVFEIEETSEVTIWAGYLPIYHDYNMRLSGEGMTPINENEKSGDALEINTTLERGIYYIDLEENYSARIEPDECWYNILVTATPVVEPDQYEPNNMIQTATPIGTNPFKTISDANLHSESDVDYYSFNLDYDLTSLSVGITNPADCSYKVECFVKGSNGKYTSIGNEEPSDTSILNWVNAGEYLVKVTSLSGSSATPYNLRVYAFKG